MSSIDQYKHKHLGFIECPASFDIIYLSKTKKVAIYELMQDIPPDETDFDGKIGDIILGGGSGEVAALRVSVPLCFLFFSSDDIPDFGEYDELFKAFWTPTESFALCEGYLKLGWSPNRTIEIWLAENLCSLLVDRFDQYKIYKTTNWDAPKALTFFESDFFNFK